jgi:HD superfamily phosphohydrolase
MQRFVIRDAVHGDVYLTADEGRLLDTREMQRLRNVRQLGLAHLVFPGRGTVASSTRSAHCT